MVAYCIMCLENYLLDRYPDRDFSPILKLAWDIVGPEGYIDQSADLYMEVIPEYLYEFDDYEAAEFEHLTPAEFDEFRRLLAPDDPTLDLLMHRIYDIAMKYAYVGLPNPPKEAIGLAWEVVGALRQSGVDLPDFDCVRSFSFDQFHGWGEYISPAGLSRIL